MTKQQLAGQTSDIKRRQHNSAATILIRRLLPLLSLLLLCSATISSQQRYVAYESEVLTVNDSADSFTTAKVASTTDNTKQAEIAIFTVNCASGTACILRFTLDGTTPTISHGMRALYGDIVKLEGHANVVSFKGLRENATNVLLDAQFFRAQ